MKIKVYRKKAEQGNVEAVRSLISRIESWESA
jgi:hypothetical protein